MPTPIRRGGQGLSRPPSRRKYPLCRLEYPHLLETLPSPRRALRVFAGFGGFLEYVLPRMREPSSRQQLELHLQVTAFLSRALPSAPLPVAYEEPAPRPPSLTLQGCRFPMGRDARRVAATNKARHVAASLPTPPATRRRSPSCRQWCRERCRRRLRRRVVQPQVARCRHGRWSPSGAASISLATT